MTIPLSLMAARAGAVHARAATINTMVLAGLVIALGVVVDDAIIDVENIIRRLRQHRARRQPRSTASVVLEASLEVRSPIVYATLIIVVAAVPIFFLDGLTGAFFRPLAVSYTLAVLASMLVALTVTPALALILLRRAPLEQRESPLVRRAASAATTRSCRGSCRRPLAGVRRLSAPRRWPAPGGRATAGPVAVPDLQGTRLPDALGHRSRAPRVAEERRIAQRGSEELRAIPGVRNFGSHIGQAFLGRRGGRRQLRRELDQHRPARRLRRRRSRSDPGRWWTATRACTATSRPT